MRHQLAASHELDTLHAGGMRGLHVSPNVKSYGVMQGIGEFAARIRPLGWQVRVHVATRTKSPISKNPRGATQRSSTESRP